MQNTRDIAVVHTHPGGLIKRLSELGYNGIACSVMSVEPVPFVLPGLYDVAIVTSRNAVQAAVKHALPVVAVGAETAKAAEKAGLTVLDVGAGRVASLQDLHSLKNLRSVHLSGRHTAGDTKSVLNALGAFSVCVYETCLRPDFPVAVQRALNQGNLHATLMFSARAARHFTGLAKRATNNDLWRNVAGVALSPRIAAAMDGLPFAELRVASAPNRNALLEALVNE